MNKFLTTLVCLCFAISTLSAQSYSGGSGKATDTYLISSKTDMEALVTATNGNSDYYSIGKYNNIINFKIYQARKRCFYVTKNKARPAKP
jgi:hypothetical protein